MFRTSRLYFKLYLYFITVILILFIATPILIFSIRTPPHQQPPHIRMNRLLFSAMYLVKASSLSDMDLKKALEKIAKEYDGDIIIYNEKKEPVIWTGDNEVTINEKIINEIKTNHIYFEKDSVFILINSRDGSYMSVSIKPPPPVPTDLLVILLIICLIVSVLVYPLASHLTKPLEEITGKAIKFSKGDFSEINKKTIIKGNDEIAQLNGAFNHMAHELVAMIEAKKDLISDISHELGSPLSRMQVAVDIIESKLEAGEMPSADTVKKLSKNINEMARLVKELLDLSRMDKAYVINTEEANLEDIVSFTVQKSQILTEKNNINIKINKTGNIEQVMVDKGKISRAIQNLLSNSIDYSPENGHIEINLKGKEGHFSFSIKDQGPGILEKNKEKIFEPFFREDSSRTRKTGGTGLGLAIVKNVINLHGGKIWVENPGEKGAIITFEI